MDHRRSHPLDEESLRWWLNVDASTLHLLSHRELIEAAPVVWFATDLLDETLQCIQRVGTAMLWNDDHLRRTLDVLRRLIPKLAIRFAIVSKPENGQEEQEKDLKRFSHALNRLIQRSSDMAIGPAIRKFVDVFDETYSEYVKGLY